jgi:ribosomal protein L12E/L44/L45/RPP1/RPP2
MHSFRRLNTMALCRTPLVQSPSTSGDSVSDEPDEPANRTIPATLTQDELDDKLAQVIAARAATPPAPSSQAPPQQTDSLEEEEKRRRVKELLESSDSELGPFDEDWVHEDGFLANLTVSDIKGSGAKHIDVARAALGVPKPSDWEDNNVFQSGPTTSGRLSSAFMSADQFTELIRSSPSAKKTPAKSATPSQTQKRSGVSHNRSPTKKKAKLDHTDPPIPLAKPQYGAEFVYRELFDDKCVAFQLSLSID